MKTQKFVVHTADWEEGYISKTLRDLARHYYGDIPREDNDIGVIYFGEVPCNFDIGEPYSGGTKKVGRILSFNDEQPFPNVPYMVHSITFIIDYQNKQVKALWSDWNAQEGPQLIIDKAMATKRISRKELEILDQTPEDHFGIYKIWNLPLIMETIKRIYQKQPLIDEALKVASVFFDKIGFE